MRATNRIGNKMRDSLRILAVAQEIGSDPHWPGDKHPTERGPFALGHVAIVEANVRPSCLSPLRERELMYIRRQVAEAVELCGRSVGNHAIGRVSLPEEHLGRELEHLCA